MSPLRGKVRRATLALIAATVAVVSSAVASQAQTRVPIVRDAEIEGLLVDYAGPIFRTAGLTHKGIDIVLVNDPSFNAFVAGRRIFMNTGAIATSQTPNEIIGVLAHEAGHIAGGHQERLRDQIARARTLAVVGSLVGIGAAAAASAAGSDASAVGGGLATMAPGVAQRSLLRYRRTEEMAADQAAVKYLNATGQSARGMLETFQRFAREGSLAGVRTNPYETSHPLPRERVALLEELARRSPYFDRRDPPALRRRHDMARGKIAAYAGGAPAVSAMFRNNPNSAGARYGMAIASFLRGDTRKALADIDRLISENRNNPYLHEMKGEILLAARQPENAVASFSRAAQLDKHNSSIIRGRLGFAYLSTGDPAQAEKAIRELRTAISADPDNFAAYVFLSRAYALAGDVARAELTQAEGYFRAGNIKDAKRFAARAQRKMQRGTPGWQRANDIVKYRRNQ